MNFTALFLIISALLFDDIFVLLGVVISYAILGPHSWDFAQTPRGVVAARVTAMYLGFYSRPRPQPTQLGRLA